MVVHGDDSTTLGTDDALDVYEQFLNSHFEVELRGRLGIEDNDANGTDILNRLVKVTPHGLVCEADPRHVQFMARTLGRENRRAHDAPVATEHDEHTVADNGLQREDLSEGTISQADGLISQPSMAQPQEMYGRG